MNKMNIILTSHNSTGSLYKIFQHHDNYQQRKVSRKILITPPFAILSQNVSTQYF